jgi:TPR repeat protein
MAISMAVAQTSGDHAASDQSWFANTVRSAEQGNAKAQFQIGLMYEMSLSVPREYAEAASWYRKAAEQGLMGSQFRLGLMYEEGKGVLQDYVSAHMWFNLAAAQGHSAAHEMRNGVARLMTPDQIAEAQRMAREWKPSSK